MRWGAGEFPTRIELAAICAEPAESFPNVLASAAFRIMQSDELYHPGTVIPGVVNQYYPSSNVPHLYLTAPSLWADRLKTTDYGTKQVSWLLAMPISEAEYSYLVEHGDHDLERLLEHRDVDLANLDRASVI